MTQRSLYLAFSNPVPEREDEFHSWYRDVHIPDLLDVPGIVSAQRYELLDAASNAGAPHAHLVAYEVDADPDEIMGEVAERFADGRIVVSDALDMASVAMTFWRPVD